MRVNPTTIISQKKRKTAGKRHIPRGTTDVCKTRILNKRTLSSNGELEKKNNDLDKKLDSNVGKNRKSPKPKKRDNDKLTEKITTMCENLHREVQRRITVMSKDKA